jgi:hypothetical protein
MSRRVDRLPRWRFMPGILAGTRPAASTGATVRAQLVLDCILIRFKPIDFRAVHFTPERRWYFKLGHYLRTGFRLLLNPHSPKTLTPV